MDCEETPTVSDKAAPALAEALQVCKGSLKLVQLGSHRFESAEAMNTVVKALCGCAQLGELDMTNSSLGEEGGAALKAVFETCPALHTIRLEDCELGEEGCLVVADALGSLSKLREIDLRNNDMEADSAEALGKSLDGKTSIEAVKLDEDLEEGADPVRSALETMGKASALVLGDDDDDDDDDDAAVQSGGDDDEGGDAANGTDE